MKVGVSKAPPPTPTLRRAPRPPALARRPAQKDTLAGRVPNVVARWGRRLHFLRVGKLSQQPSLEVFPTLVLFPPVNEDLALETVTSVSYTATRGGGGSARTWALALGLRGTSRVLLVENARTSRGRSPGHEAPRTAPPSSRTCRGLSSDDPVTGPWKPGAAKARPLAGTDG